MKNLEDFDLSDALNYENVNELKYYSMCFSESLRILPPVTYSSSSLMTEELNLGKYKIRANQEFLIDIHFLHRNPKQWIEPDKFIPERFDPKSKYFLTPDGKKRHPMVFTPFLGGKRICIGKTFAETVSKIVGPSLLWAFDFKFVEGYGKKEVSLPLSQN